MPLYEYKCLKCGKHTEKIETVGGPHLKKCPHCGGKVESVITAPAIKFKGSGWYVTDYAGKSTDGGSKESKPRESKESGAKDAGKDAVATAGDGKDSAGAKDSSSKETSSKESSSKEKKPAKKK